jgi:hypothetical protein
VVVQQEGMTTEKRKKIGDGAKDFTYFGQYQRECENAAGQDIGTFFRSGDIDDKDSFVCVKLDFIRDFRNKLEFLS